MVDGALFLNPDVHNHVPANCKQKNKGLAVPFVANRVPFVAYRVPFVANQVPLAVAGAVALVAWLRSHFVELSWH